MFLVGLHLATNATKHERGDIDPRMEQLKDILSGLSHLDLGDQIVDKQIHASRYGASCDVYSAWSNRHNKKVAVKQIRVFMVKDQVFAKVCLPNITSFRGY